VGCSERGTYKGGRLQFWTQAHEEDESFALWTGDAVVFTSAEENIHSVEAVSAGTRHQLLIWFTLPGGSPVHPDEAFIARWLMSLDATSQRFSRLVRFKTELATHGLGYLLRHRIRGAQARVAAAQKGVAWIDAQSLKRIGMSSIEARMLIRMVDAAQVGPHNGL
jgi:hypothetical protein